MASVHTLTPIWWPSIPNSAASLTVFTPGQNLTMSENPGVQIVGARSKRTHRQMADESNDNANASWYQPTYPPHAESSSSRLPPPRTPTTPRHGYDYRRPVILSPENNVIDLTDDPEPPRRNLVPVSRSRSTMRFPRDIMNGEPPVIDLEAEEDHPVEGSSTSADLEIVGSAIVRPRPSPMYIDEHGFTMHFPPTRPRPRTRPRDSGYGQRFSIPDFQDSGNSDELFSYMTSVPGVLQYSLSAFNLNPPTQSAPQPRRSSYKAPIAAAEGFTRCLENANVPVCPHCEQELGAGEGRKQEIYIAKPCGHVYCGECAENRSLSKSKKSSSQTKPFSKCQVDGCNRPVSSQTAMVHLFL